MMSARGQRCRRGTSRMAVVELSVLKGEGRIWKSKAAAVNDI